jgi:hypothetical protein
MLESARRVLEYNPASAVSPFCLYLGPVLTRIYSASKHSHDRSPLFYHRKFWLEKLEPSEMDLFREREKGKVHVEKASSLDRR